MYDQPIYTKAFQIESKEPNVSKKVQGVFVTVTAARIKDAGLDHIVFQSLIVAEGSVDTEFSSSLS